MVTLAHNKTNICHCTPRSRYREGQEAGVDFCSSPWIQVGKKAAVGNSWFFQWWRASFILGACLFPPRSDSLGGNNGRSSERVQFKVPAVCLVQLRVTGLRRQRFWMFQAGLAEKLGTHKSYYSEKFLTCLLGQSMSEYEALKTYIHNFQKYK